MIGKGTKMKVDLRKEKGKQKIASPVKVCSCCLQEKNKNFFNKHSNKFDGLSCYCKECSRKKQKTDTVKAIVKRSREKSKVKNIVRYRCTSFRGNSRKRHESEPPTIDQLEELVRKQLNIGCFYTKEKITEKDFGIDHKIPLSRGGTNDISNLCVVTQSINKAKGNMTDTEFKQLLKVIRKWEDGGTAMLTRLKLAGTIFKR